MDAGEMFQVKKFFTFCHTINSKNKMFGLPPVGTVSFDGVTKSNSHQLKFKARRKR